MSSGQISCHSDQRRRSTLFLFGETFPYRHTILLEVKTNLELLYNLLLCMASFTRVSSSFRILVHILVLAILLLKFIAITMLSSVGQHIHPPQYKCIHGVPYATNTEAHTLQGRPASMGNLICLLCLRTNYRQMGAILWKSV